MPDSRFILITHGVKSSMSKIINWKSLTIISMFLLGGWFIVGLISVFIKVSVLLTGTAAAILFVEDKCGGCNIKE